MMVNRYKEEFDDLTERHDSLKQTIADVEARKKLAEETIKKLDKTLLEATKGKDPGKVLDKLRNEIEARMNTLRDSVMVIEAKVEASKLGDVDALVDDELDALMQPDK
jgi:hypothetical protein